MTLKYRGVDYQPATVAPGTTPSQKGIYRGVPFSIQQTASTQRQPSSDRVYRGVKYVA